MSAFRKGQKLTIHRNGPNVESESGKSLKKRFIKELFERLESIAPGIAEV